MTGDPFAEYLRPTSAAEELATLLSVAVRIEPELIRAVRLELTPRYDVGAEADLWFSDWVSGRSADSIRLRSEILPRLRDRLARRLANDRHDPAWRLWELIVEVHRDISPALLLEEEVTWTAVRAAAGAAEPEDIERVLRPALRAILNHRTGVADWFDAALPRLPATVQQSRVAWQLLQFSPRRSAAPALASEHWLELSDVHALGGLVPDALMPIRHDGTHLRLNEPTVTQRHLLLPVPDTRPRVLNIRWATSQGERQQTVRINPNHSLTLAVPPGSVRIQTGRGLVYELGSHATAEAEDVPTASIPVVLDRYAHPGPRTAEELRTAALDLRERRLPVDEELVSAIEAEVASLRAAVPSLPTQEPPPDVVERLPLLGWLLYEASLQVVQRIPAAFESLSAEPQRAATAAYELVRRLADAARSLPWPEFAPRALGAIRAAALAEAKRDTEAGYDAAWLLHTEAADRHAQLGEHHSGKPADLLALDEILIQLALAEVGTACRVAEQVLGRWPEAATPGRRSADDEAAWIQRMFNDLSSGLAVGERALDAAERIDRNFGFVDAVSEDRLALTTSYRNPAILTARAASLLLAMSAEMERLDRLPKRGESWPDARTRLVMSFERAYRMLERPVLDAHGAPRPLLGDYARSVVQLRLTLGLLMPGFRLPSTSGFDPVVELDPLDDTAVEALSGWLAEQVDGKQRGDANILGSAAMPAFIRSVEACRASAGPTSTYRDWRRRWPSLDRYAEQPGREALLEAALRDASSTGAAETQPEPVLESAEDPAPALTRSPTYAGVHPAIRRALAREDLLRIATDADQAVGIVRQREALRRRAVGEQELYQLALDHHLRMAERDEGWAVRAQATIYAGVLVEFCGLTGIPLDRADKVPPLLDLTSRLDPHEALDASPPISDAALRAFAGYRNVRTRRLRGDLNQAIELARLPADAFYGSGAEPLLADYQFELGASLLASGRPDQVATALANDQSWAATRAAQFSNGYRIDFVLGLAAWARGEHAEANRRLGAARDRLRHTGSQDVAALSSALATAELAATEAHPAAVARAQDLALAALSLLERIPGRCETLAQARSPLSIALQRVYGDLALLASTLPGEAAATFGLAVSVSAKQCQLATNLRTRSHLLPAPVRGLVDEVVDAERPKSYISAEAPSRNTLETLRHELAEAVTPTFAGLVLPAPVGTSPLRSSLGRRAAVDFIALPDTLDGTATWFRAVGWPAGMVFERWTPGTQTSSIMANTDMPPPEADIEWRELAQELLPGPLAPLLNSATVDQPLDLVISPPERFGPVPWAGLKIDDHGTRLVERAVIALTPTLAILARTEPPPVRGPALIQLVAPPEGGVLVDRIRAAWDLPASADGGTSLYGCALGTETAPPNLGQGLAEALSKGRHQWGLVHIAARGAGYGLDETLAVPEPLTAGRALATPWPESVLITGKAFDDESAGLVIALLAGWTRCVVLDAGAGADPTTEQLSATIVSIVRAGPTSLHRALRLAQLQLLDLPPAYWARCSAHLR